MNDRRERTDIDDTGEESIRQLLREVGAREQPGADIADEVRRAVHDEWRELVASKRRRARFIGYGIAATVAAAAVAVAFTLRFSDVSAQPIGMVARVDGVPQVTDDSGDTWRPVTVGEELLEGVLLRTDAGTRVALTLADVSLRLDAGSLVRLQSASRMSLDHGAVYVDAKLPGAEALVVETSYGSVRHIGTQYEVRTTRGGLEVSIREGRVEVARANDKFTAGAGEQLVVSVEGEPERRVLAQQDPRWQWAVSIAPVFDIERQPLSQFLEWAAREMGKTVVYESADVRARAGQLILRGSVSNLPPSQALAAVLATTPFEHVDAPTEIRIGL